MNTVEHPPVDGQQSPLKRVYRHTAPLARCPRFRGQPLAHLRTVNPTPSDPGFRMLQYITLTATFFGYDVD